MIGLAVLGAFENGVFHEVGETIFEGLLITGASLHHQYKVRNFAFFLFVYQSDTVY